ncbi:hypothetical protein [Sphingopyxis sp. GW247-27LB]|uniref:hypothetical protein n=1 Tax=Sphingopyxis sp. GW247-27LB TaxID=2012632 RepID=UPI000BA72D3E|nr:hypothetical protein [Sphingopyxis sp. GW247-27LB]PAL25473.1 hypothetical protein CD928_03095 [Sphingopyxis sp. GW247-27LB]
MDKRYTLLRPIGPKDGDKVTEVAIVEPTGADLEVLDEFLIVNAAGETVMTKPMAYTLTMIDRLVRYPNGDPMFPGFSRMLKASDVDKLGELVMAMLPDGQKTGGTA